LTGERGDTAQKRITRIPLVLPGTAAVLAGTIEWLMTEFPLNMDSKLLPGLRYHFSLSLYHVLAHYKQTHLTHETSGISTGKSAYSGKAKRQTGNDSLGDPHPAQG
jgi:hypothetical protein